MSEEKKIKSVAVVGAGAAGAITAAALKAENYFERIRVFDRRETPGGTWIFDSDPQPALKVQPGKLPPDVDPPLEIPPNLPQVTTPDRRERFSQTPIYNSLTTNVPDIAMSFSDRRFAYGPFAPHYIPRQYLESYFSAHGTDKLLSLNTTVEDVTKLPATVSGGLERWKLTLRKYDPARHVDAWWEEEFDAVILANGHYSVPYVPHVDGLEAYIAAYPGRVLHSKYYRTPLPYTNKKVLVIGNSASGHDLTAELVSTATLPVLQSRRSASRWDGDVPPPGIRWKPVIQSYSASTGEIHFSDGTTLSESDIDHVIYATGYKPSFPFWNSARNGGPLFDYAANKLVGNYLHTFIRAHPTLAIVGIPRVLTFRSFEYQAVALARLFSARNTGVLPSVSEQERWEREREERTRRERRKFHDVDWESGETLAWLGALFDIAGLGTLRGEGRIPPALTEEVIWAIEHVRKYPEPGKGKEKEKETEVPSKDKQENGKERRDGEWVLVERQRKDLLAFI
ncbi:putative dimethylaniline monooxygenase [Annulohypoxylon maeteangense]|uniref:putative dimethylaniline monooxygenase n=1 Tax=Annulohypoxylon maeteangense TaxID=1927788 RepID=UPI002007F8E0|nr:putative dimethylaniline monooxygenase [Annulohypoxylon maeteangense]KAI0883986.1 putative dimethylaniline monooxygenase [Annulohypoxylon maeteangense]